MYNLCTIYVYILWLTRIHSIAAIVTFSYILSLDTLVFLWTMNYMVLFGSL